MNRAARFPAAWTVAAWTAVAILFAGCGPDSPGAADAGHEAGTVDASGEARAADAVPDLCSQDSDCPSPTGACKVGHCVAGACEFTARPNGTACETCASCGACTCQDEGSCVPSPPDACDDGNPCTLDECRYEALPLHCVHLDVNEGPCDDGNACSVGDHCTSATCEAFARGCDDGNPCTADSCLDGCQHGALSSGPCLGGGGCGTCDQGTCATGPATADLGWDVTPQDVFLAATNTADAGVLVVGREGKQVQARRYTAQGQLVWQVAWPDDPVAGVAEAQDGGFWHVSAGTTGHLVQTTADAKVVVSVDFAPGLAPGFVRALSDGGCLVGVRDLTPGLPVTSGHVQRRAQDGTLVWSVDVAATRVVDAVAGPDGWRLAGDVETPYLSPYGPSPLAAWTGWLSQDGVLGGQTTAPIELPSFQTLVRYSGLFHLSSGAALATSQGPLLVLTRKQGAVPSAGPDEHGLRVDPIAGGKLQDSDDLGLGPHAFTVALALPGPRWVVGAHDGGSPWLAWLSASGTLQGRQPLAVPSTAKPRAVVALLPAGPQHLWVVLAAMGGAAPVSVRRVSVEPAVCP